MKKLCKKCAYKTGNRCEEHVKSLDLIKEDFPCTSFRKIKGWHG